MKTNLTCTLLLVLLLGSAATPRRAFAECSCASDFMTAIERTELKVALKQYEKVLTLRYDAMLEESSAAPESGANEEHKEARRVQAARRLKALDTMAGQLRLTIRDLTLNAEKQAKEARAKTPEK
jgi:hypothetical protein